MRSVVSGRRRAGRGASRRGCCSAKNTAAKTIMMLHSTFNYVTSWAGTRGCFCGKHSHRETNNSTPHNLPCRPPTPSPTPALATRACLSARARHRLQVTTQVQSPLERASLQAARTATARRAKQTLILNEAWGDWWTSWAESWAAMYVTPSYMLTTLTFSRRNFQAGLLLPFHPPGRPLPWGPILLTFLLLLHVPHRSQALHLATTSLKSMRLPSQGHDAQARFLHTPRRMKTAQEETDHLARVGMAIRLRRLA